MKNLTKTEKAILAKIGAMAYDGAHGVYELPSLMGWSKRKNKVNQWCTGLYRHGDTDIAVISIRGSDEGSPNPFVKQDDSRSDWGYNFDIKLIRKTVESRTAEIVIPYGNTDSKIRMAQGAVEHFNLIRRDVRDFVRAALRSGVKHIAVCGHSLGGADTTVGFIDILYMLRDEMGLAVNCGGDSIDLTGFAMSAYAVGNAEFRDSFNRRADGNFYNEWFGNDSVHSYPPYLKGYRHVGIEKRYDDPVSAIQTPFVNALHWVTLGTLPSVAAYDHYPQKLIAAIEGKSIPRFGALK